jgi:hypothetical protein
MSTEGNMADENEGKGGETEGSGESHFEECKKALEEHGIHLPEHTDESNFVEHLCVALHALNAGGDEEKPAEEETPAREETKEEPMTVAMSLAVAKATDPLKHRLSLAEQELADSRLERHSTRIADLTRTGRVTPVQAAKWKETLQAKRMSLGDGKDTSVAGVLAQMDYAASLPNGAMWSPEERTKNYRMSLEPQKPDSYFPDPAKAKSEQDDVIKQMVAAGNRQV